MNDLQTIYAESANYDHSPRKALASVYELLWSLAEEHPQQVSDLLTELDPTKLCSGIVIGILTVTKTTTAFVPCADARADFYSRSFAHFGARLEGCI